MIARNVLVVAAEGFELGGLLGRLDQRAKLDWPVRFAWRGRVREVLFWMVADGPGPRLAGRAADVAHEREGADVMVSTGLCGALDPSLRVGDIFVATRIVDVETGETFVGRMNELPRERRYAEGLLCSRDRVAFSSGDKAVLRALGAAAVEMEAAAVARRSRDWNLPFYCVRVVSDAADETFSMDLNQMRDGEGRFRRGRIAASAMMRPWSRVPELVRLQRRAQACAEILGELLADCRF